MIKMTRILSREQECDECETDDSSTYYWEYDDGSILCENCVHKRELKETNHKKNKFNEILKKVGDFLKKIFISISTYIYIILVVLCAIVLLVTMRRLFQGKDVSLNYWIETINLFARLDFKTWIVIIVGGVITYFFKNRRR